MSIRYILAAATLSMLVACSTNPALESSTESVRLSDVKQGLYIVRELMRLPDKGALTGEVAILDGVAFREETDRVPMRLGTSFGVQWVVNSELPRNTFIFTYVWTYPDTASGTHERKRFSRDVVCAKGSLCRAGYTLTDEVELIEGEWQFELLRDGRRLIRKKFNVVAN